MRIPIPCHHHRFIIKLTITAFEPMILSIKVYEPSRRNSYYVKRVAHFRPAQLQNGAVSRTFELRMPISPDKAILKLSDKEYGDDDSFELNDLKIEPMPKGKAWASPERHRFMEFAIDFAQKCGSLPTGFYPSEKDEFLIQYLPTITGDDGKELVTPARIHRHMPRVQLSQKLFRQFSIPLRVAILSHEACHYFKNTRSEKKADLCGIAYYMDSGFSSLEAIYALTKVFNRHADSLGDMHVTRVKDVYELVNQKRKERKAVA